MALGCLCHSPNSLRREHDWHIPTSVLRKRFDVGTLDLSVLRKRFDVGMLDLQLGRRRGENVSGKL